MTKVYLNGTFLDPEEAKVSVFDHGFLYGDGIFETLRAYTGRIFRVAAHLDRLFASAASLSLTLPWDRQTLTRILEQSLRVNRCENAVLRLSISRGIGPPGLDPDLCAEPTITVLTRPFQGYPAKVYEEGLSIALVPVRKIRAEALDPRIKSANFLNNILAKIEAKKAGVDEGILLNHAGFLAEGTVSNFFFVREGLLCTPSPAAGILEGVSRKVVLEIAEEEGIPLQAGLFLPQELEAADEIFLTNTTYEVVAVSRCGRRPLTPGPVTGKVRQAFRRKVEQ